jgi:hypothetical protein
MKNIYGVDQFYFAENDQFSHGVYTLKYRIVFRSGSFSGYHRKFMNEMRPRTPFQPADQRDYTTAAAAVSSP